MQVGLPFKNIIIMMHDCSRLKLENHKITLIAAEKAFDKIEHLFM
jgi:hypothetical protein